MMKSKRVPLRMCSGCGAMVDKKQLVRVVKSKDGEVSLDLQGKKPGRGAYVCKNLDCLKKARKAKRFEKTFKMQISSDIFDQMEQEMMFNE